MLFSPININRSRILVALSIETRFENKVMKADANNDSKMTFWVLKV
jgi:hypothetical protein